jgi:hypothetical protein
MSASPPPSLPPRRTRRRLGLIITLTLVLIVAVGLSLWSWIALTYVYASGQHTGYIRKLTKTGWLCKTWEGQLVTSPTPAVQSQLFNFTIHDDSLATLIQNAHDKQVTLSYSQYLTSPSTCLGETRYFIEGITVSP